MPTHKSVQAGPRRGYKQTEIGVIPVDWEVKKVGDVFELGRGRVISHPYIEAHQGPYPVYSSQTTKDGVMGFIDTFDFEGEMITWTTDGANAGSVFYRNGRFNCTNVCGTVRPKDGSTHLPFMAYYLGQSTDKYVSKVGNDKLMNNIFSVIPIPLPPLPEQKKIAAILSSVDDAIRSTQAVIDQARTLKKGLLGQLLTRGIGHKKFKQTEIGEIPVEWDVKRLEEISRCVRERVGDKKLVTMSISAGIGFVPQSEKFGRDISGSQYTLYTVLRQGQFAYNKGNSKSFPEGCIYLLYDNNEIAVPNVFICFELNQKFCFNHYFQQLFLNNAHGRELKVHINSGTRNNGLLNLTPRNFFSIRLPLPPLPEQKQIAEILSGVDAVIRQNSDQVEQLKRTKAGLMQDILNGRKRVAV